MLRIGGKRSHSRDIGLRCGILLKAYLEIGGYEMCAGSGSRWVPITVLDLRVPGKAKKLFNQPGRFYRLAKDSAAWRLSVG